MKKTLVIKIPSAEIQATTPISWYVFGDSALLRSGSAALAELAQVLSGSFDEGETLVLVPGELVLLVSVRIPSQQIRQIKQALPYMVEELIADNIEDVHLALPDIKPEQNAAMPVAVVRHHLLIDWLDQLYQHGIKPDWICPDSLAAPWRVHSRSFFVAGKRVIFRSAQFGAQVFFMEQAAVYLPLLRRQFAADELGAVPRYSVASGAESASDAHALQQVITTEFNVEVELTEFAEGGDEVLAAEALRTRDASINLLQGGYAVQQPGGVAQWSRTLKFAAGALVLYAFVTAASGMWYSWRARDVEQQTFSLYRDMFPQERRVVSPKKQMLAHMGGNAVTTSPLPLLTKTALGLRNNTLQLDELRYSKQHDDLQLQLRTPTLDALDKIKQQLSGVGLQVDITSAAQRGQETVGRLHLRDS
ncbi:MAG TPA: type II secretion system protein GspL [Spongiibacteraceae bacterium]|nr:type II secretion system protein GspL [Spongiibacteraceae bacterium]